MNKIEINVEYRVLKEVYLTIKQGVTNGRNKKLGVWVNKTDQKSKKGKKYLGAK